MSSRDDSFSLLTPDDLAAKFGGEVTGRLVIDWTRRYSWPCVRVGRKIRFTHDNVREILTRHAVKPAEGEPVVTVAGQTPRSAARNAS